MSEPKTQLKFDETRFNTAISELTPISLPKLPPGYAPSDDCTTISNVVESVAVGLTTLTTDVVDENTVF